MKTLSPQHQRFRQTPEPVKKDPATIDKLLMTTDTTSESPDLDDFLFSELTLIAYWTNGSHKKSDML
jgi:hypothetical protein